MFLKIEGSVGDLRGFLEKVKLFQGRDGVPWRKCAGVFFRVLRGLAVADPAGPLRLWTVPIFLRAWSFFVVFVILGE